MRLQVRLPPPPPSFDLNQGFGRGLDITFPHAAAKLPAIIGANDLGSRLQPLPESEQDRIAVFPAWQLLHTSGLTPGHVSFYRPDDRTLLVGDAFCSN
jgi:glyoxylase-like metal-dependent hydrolase (beta-lactamase superfamily II)